MANIKNVASYLVSLSQPSSPRAITPSKLQKLVYFAQGVHLRKHSQPLFTEEVFACNQRPVHERNVVKEGWSERKFTDVTIY